MANKIKTKEMSAEKNETTELIVADLNQRSIGNAFGYTPEEVALVQHTVARNTTKVELAYFLNVCKTMEMNPFNKEVWCYKDTKKNLLIFAGRDGFLSKAQKNPLFNGIRSCEVREHDEWSIDIANGKIVHKITKNQKERGGIIGAYAIVFRKGGEPTIEWSDFETYNKGYNAWSTHPAEMIKKVSESHALKKAFGISGIQSEHDFDIKDGVAIPNNTKIPTNKEYQRITNHINNAKTIQILKQIEPFLEDDLHKNHYGVKFNELESAD